MSTTPSKLSRKHKKKISVVKNDTIGDFKIGVKIGQGTFSKVCQGIHIPTGEKVAIKILPKYQIKEKNDKIRIEKEIVLQKKLHHQNIIQQYSILDTESSIYIITEYCSGGELFDYIVSKRRLPENEACRIYQQLINGLEYLHKQKICHRDLKPENLLFDSKHNLKIADFGLSNDYLYGKLSTPCGSPCYAAPEMVTGKKYFGDTVDIWSSGIVLFSMVCGYLPFEDDDQTLLFHKIAKGLFTLPSFLSNSCKDLIKKILVTNPKKRYGFEEIKKHPWFMSVNNIGGKNILFSSPGILIDYDVIPIDINIIKEIYYTKEYKNFSILNIVNDVIRNKHNKITTAYYLILKKKLRNNEESISNINSTSKLFIDYIKKPISKMEYWDNNYDKIIEYYTNKVKETINKEKESKKKEDKEKEIKKKQIKEKEDKEKENKEKERKKKEDKEKEDKEKEKEKEKEKSKNNKKLKNKNLQLLCTDKDILNINNLSNFFYEEENENEDENQNKYLETNFLNDDIKLSTIVYDDEEKYLFRNKRRSKLKNKNNNYNKETDDSHFYKGNNYELDSDEPIMEDILDSSRNKKQFYEIAKTNENVIEENYNSIFSKDNINILNKIIKNIDNIEIDKKKNINGRNKDKIERKNNSVCIGKNTNIKDLILSDKPKHNKKIMKVDINKKNTYNLSIDKTNIKENNNDNNNRNALSSINDKKNKDIKDNKNFKKEKIKKKKLNNKKYTVSNNSYFYRKIASMVGNKDDKILKFINKKKQNNLSQKEKEDKNKNNVIKIKLDNIYCYNKNIDKPKYNFRNESQDYKNNQNENNYNYINTSTTNITNGQKEYTSIFKNQNEISPKIHPKINYANNKTNNLRIKNINNYNIDIYKYKINLINNNPSYTKEINLQDFYKKLSDIHNMNNINRYNKFISINQNNKNIYNNHKISLKRRRYFNNSVNSNQNNNFIINKYLITDNNHRIYKKSCPSHLNCFDIYINGNSKRKIDPILLSEKLNKKRAIINAMNEQERMKFKKINKRSIDKNILKTDKIPRKIKKFLPFKIQNGRANSVEFKTIKNKYIFNKRNLNKYIETNNTYFSNGSNQNISFWKDKTPKNNIITEINQNPNRSQILNSDINNKFIKRTKNYSLDIRNDFKYMDNQNNNLLLNKKNMIYHKKLININKRYNNSVESNQRQKNYIMDLPFSNSNNRQYNNSLIAISNKNKKKEKLFKKAESKKYFEGSQNNIDNGNIKSSLKNLKGMIVKKINFLSQEKVSKKLNLINNPFNLPTKAKIAPNNNIVFSNIQNNKIKNENLKSTYHIENKIIDEINKIQPLICCKTTIDKLKELVERIFFKNDKINSAINIISSYSGVILRCKILNKISNLNFELHVSNFNDAKNYVLIKPSLKNGNNSLFFELFEKLKNELL